MGVTIVDTQDTAKIKKMKNFNPTGNCPIRGHLVPARRQVVDACFDHTEREWHDAF